ncbi:MAG: hypothetical protein ABIS50_03905 [Luteolibacter sp.]|uniref:hypothetical protein n=1 Tax=Luteolibacter sp. TaxID=1962973 RepID=UPI003264705E
MSEHIEDILRKQRSQQEETGEKPALIFFQPSRIEGADESFLELRFRKGIKTAFSYQSLSWFNLDPGGGMLDLGFGGFVVTLEGRGLDDLFQAIKTKRVSWVREADEEMQDIPDLPLFIKDIFITPPDDFGSDESS